MGYVEPVEGMLLSHFADIRTLFCAKGQTVVMFFWCSSNWFVGGGDELEKDDQRHV